MTNFLCQAVLLHHVVALCILLAVLSRFGKLSKSFRMHSTSSPNWHKVIVYQSAQFHSSSEWITLTIECLPLILILMPTSASWIMIDSVTASNRFAKAYHLRGLLLHGMGEHRYVVSNSLCSILRVIFHLGDCACNWFSRSCGLLMVLELGKNK